MSTMKTKTGGSWELWGGGVPAPISLELTVVNTVPILTPVGGVFSDIVIAEASATAYEFSNPRTLTGLPVGVIHPSPAAIGTYGEMSFAGTRIEEFTLNRGADAASVLAIGNYCFAECRLLKRILFNTPVSLTRLNISTSAFLNCENLEYLEAPGEKHFVTGFSAAMFSGCTKFDGQFEHASGTALAVGGTAFLNCAAIKCPVPPTQPITSLGSRCFEGCTGLVNFVVLFSTGSTTTGLAADIFRNCDASQITLDFRNRSAMVSFAANAFRGVVTTDGPVTIIVPNSLLATYTANGSWAAEVSAGRVQFVGV